jgi:hypothetical protein
MACEACANETNGGTALDGASSQFFRLLFAVLVIGVLAALFKD